MKPTFATAKAYFLDLPTISPVEGENWKDANLKFIAHLQSITSSSLGLHEAVTTFADDVIKFFSGGIETRLFQGYVRYAMNSLYRGAKVAIEVVSGESVIKRYLDVGCAYGGCPIVMAETQSANECVGLEYESRLLPLANKLAKERQVADRVSFSSGDITVLDSVRELGKFDLITCLDVLEHVLDPKAAIQCLVHLMADKAILRVDIPNKYSFEQIKSDPHHHLFGSILLNRTDAVAVFEHEYPGNKRYTVGYFHPLEWYLEEFASCGVDVEIMDRVKIDSEFIEKTRKSVCMLDGEFNILTRDQDRWPRWRVDMVSHQMKEMYSRMNSDFDAVSAGALSPERFQIRYSVPVFHLRCSKGCK